VNALAAMALAAGELLCEFDSGAMLLYAMKSADEGAVLQAGRAGRRPVFLRESSGQVHLVQDDGASIRMTTLTSCIQTKGSACTRFTAAHAWHFDHRARKLPHGAAPGRCEPWKMD
jgi:hypothetical protein